MTHSGTLVAVDPNKPLYLYVTHSQFHIRVVPGKVGELPLAGTVKIEVLNRPRDEQIIIHKTKRPPGYADPVTGKSIPAGTRLILGDKYFGYPLRYPNPNDHQNLGLLGNESSYVLEVTIPAGRTQPTIVEGRQARILSIKGAPETETPIFVGDIRLNEMSELELDSVRAAPNSHIVMANKCFVSANNVGGHFVIGSGDQPSWLWINRTTTEDQPSIAWGFSPEPARFDVHKAPGNRNTLKVACKSELDTVRTLPFSDVAAQFDPSIIHAYKLPKVSAFRNNSAISELGS